MTRESLESMDSPSGQEMKTIQLAIRMGKLQYLTHLNHDTQGGGLKTEGERQGCRCDNRFEGVPMTENTPPATWLLCNCNHCKSGVTRHKKLY